MPFVVMQVDPVASATRVVRADGGMVTLADGWLQPRSALPWTGG